MPMVPRSLPPACALAFVLVVACPSPAASQEFRHEVAARAADQVAAGGGAAAAILHTSMGQRLLIVARRGDIAPVRVDRLAGLELAGLGGDRVPSLATDGSFLAIDTGRGDSLVVCALASCSPRTVEIGGRIVAGPVLEDGDLWVATQDEAGVRVVRLPVATAGSAGDRVESPPLPPPAAPFDLLVAPPAAVLGTRNGGQAFVWERGHDWRAIDLPIGARPVGIVGRRCVVQMEGSVSLLAEPGESGAAAAGLQLYRPEPGRRLVPGSARQVERRFVVFEEGEAPSAPLELVAFTADRGASGDQGAEAARRVLSPWAGQEDSQTWAMDGDAIVRAERRGGRLFLSRERIAGAAEPTLPSRSVAAVAPGVVPSGAPAAAHAVPAPDIGTADGHAPQRALRWLLSRLAPTFETRWGMARLITSYEHIPRAGWVYDAALASIALTAAGRPAPARELLAGLAHLQAEDGSWAFSFDAFRASPFDSPRYVGSIAWVVMAINYYEWNTRDATFAGVANDALAFVARFVVREAGALEGAVSMGPAGVGEFSAEHNADTHSAFLWRGILDRRHDYLEMARRIADFLLTGMAASRDDGRRFFKVGFRDRTLYLDAQTWTALSLAPISDDVAMFEEAIATARDALTEEGGKLGATTGIAGFNVAEAAHATAKVWSEGSEGMVAALLLLGDRTGRQDMTEAAARFHAQTARYQAATGGIPYATENGEGWATEASVAGTAWYLLNSVTPRRNPFHPGDPRSPLTHSAMPDVKILTPAK
jgi:hypothetical protein